RAKTSVGRSGSGIVVAGGPVVGGTAAGTVVGAGASVGGPDGSGAEVAATSRSSPPSLHAPSASDAAPSTNARRDSCTSRQSTGWLGLRTGHELAFAAGRLPLVQPFRVVSDFQPAGD